MNRRDFLGLFRGLAVLPFVKLPATEVLTDAEVEGIRREYEALPPSRNFYSLLDLDKLGSYSYSLSTSYLSDTLDVSYDPPLHITYQEGNFISVWVDGRLLREGYVKTAGRYGFTLVSPFAALGGRY